MMNGFPANDDQPPPRLGDLAILEVVTISLLAILPIVSIEIDKTPIISPLI